MSTGRGGGGDWALYAAHTACTRSDTHGRIPLESSLGLQITRRMPSNFGKLGISALLAVIVGRSFENANFIHVDASSNGIPQNITKYARRTFGDRDREFLQ